jgi:hypothetical protein
MDRKFELKVKSFGGPRKSAKSARLFPDGSMASWPVPLLTGPVDWPVPLMKAKPHAVSVICPVNQLLGVKMTQFQRGFLTDRDGAFGDFNSVWFICTCSHMRQRRAKVHRAIEG